MYVCFNASEIIIGLKISIDSLIPYFGLRSSVFRPKNKGNLAGGAIADKYKMDIVGYWILGDIK